VLAQTAGNEAVNLCLVKDANTVLADRLVYVLNKSVETLSKEDKGRPSNRIRCVRQRCNVDYVQAVEIAWLPHYLKLWQYLRL
jgi:hypothetical protein